MSYRAMRIFCLFDLPTTSKEEQKAYRLFRKFLLKEGFIMMQYSVYVKFIMYPNALKANIDKIRAKAPGGGLVSVLAITEKQFSKMEFIGEKISWEPLSNDERFLCF